MTFIFHIIIKISYWFIFGFILFSYINSIKFTVKDVGLGYKIKLLLLRFNKISNIKMAGIIFISYIVINIIIYFCHLYFYLYILKTNLLYELSNLHLSFNELYYLDTYNLFSFSESTSSSALNNSESTSATPSYQASTPAASTNPAPSASTNPTATAVGVAVDGTIAATTIAASKEIAVNIPGVGGKFAAVAAGILIGGGAIGIKILASNGTRDLGKRYFDLYGFLGYFFNLTGNNSYDLLTLILYFNKLNLYILYIIFYNIIINFVNINKVEVKLNKYLPSGKLIFYIIKSLRITQKSSKFILIVFFVFLCYSSYNSYHYLNFFHENFDGFVDLYLRDKNK